MTSVRIRLDKNNNVVKEFYKLYYSVFDKEFTEDDNYVAIWCFPIFFYDEPLRKEILNYIRSNSRNEDTKYYFDNMEEGHIYACLPGIHEIINILDLDPKKCYFITAAMDAREIYNEFCIKENIQNKINIIPVATWARSLKFSSNLEKVKEHEFLIEPKEKIFLCFNRIFRTHRVSLLGLLYNKGLVEKAYYSFTPQSWNINILKSYLSEKTTSIVLDEYSKNLGKLPLILNNPDLKPANNIQEDDLKFFKNSYFSLVTETFFFSTINRYVDEHAVFFSEKIFKPILCKHPFVLVGRPKSLNYLKKLGFKTFHPYIDESYDLIENDEDRLLAVVNEVERLSKKTTGEWMDLLKAVEEVVNYNFNVLINKSEKEFILN